MICKVSDFSQIMCIAAEGEPNSKIQACTNELDSRLVLVKVDFRGDLVLSQHPETGEMLVIVGRGGTGGPAAMLSRKLMPEVNVTLVSEEERFIVR